VYLVAPNYQAGKDSLAGFKRTFKGQVIGENYTKLGQLDYAAELAEIRAAKPQAVYIFLPGGMGINFIKQYVGAGIGKDTALLLPAFSPTRTSSTRSARRWPGSSTPRTGRPISATRRTRSSWPSSRRNTSACRRCTPRRGYDAAQLINAAVRDVKGKVEDRQAVRRALKAAHFDSVRGSFKFNVNQYPVQNYYVRTIGSDGKVA
jgi:branched-chain amino acid transport system substrate-binding protein